MYTRPDKPDYIDTKGIQLVRRDSCGLVKDVSSAMLDAIMYKKDASMALAVAVEHVVTLLSGACTMSQLVLSKTLRGNYVNEQPHQQVALKIAERRGMAVPLGTRVEYLLLENLDDPLCLQAAKAEDPAYVAEHGLPLDLLYYLEHQLMSPVCALLGVMTKDPRRSILEHPRVRPLLHQLQERHDKAVRALKRRRQNVPGQTNITAYFARSSSSSQQASGQRAGGQQAEQAKNS